MKISPEKCIQLILQKFPGFLPMWNSYKANEDKNYPMGLLWQMCEFSSYVSSLLTESKNDSSQNKEIFSYMEELLVKGDEEVKDAGCPCFLENILNKPPHDINPKKYVHLLGPRSRAYCLAWDEFIGVKIEGSDELL